eukprot:SM000320S12008  [mRNA]  locus=s320:99123:101347:- [translate_table: standard]
MHCHRRKQEDIIARVGTLALRLASATGDAANLLEDVTADRGGPPVRALLNGIEHFVESNSVLYLNAGERVTVYPGVFHEFWPVSDYCIIGEVSTANDDQHDNVFENRAAGRFESVIEDEPALEGLLGKNSVQALARLDKEPILTNSKSKKEEHPDFVSQTYMLKRSVLTVKEVWDEFYHSGPHGKPPVIQLMARWGEKDWFALTRTKEGQQNRINIWNGRNKAIVLEILWRMRQLSEREDEAIAYLELRKADLKPPSVPSLAMWLKAEGVIADKGPEGKKEQAVMYMRDIIRNLVPQPDDASRKRLRM